VKDWDITKITDWKPMKAWLRSEAKIILIKWLRFNDYIGFVCEPNETRRGACECHIINLTPCGLAIPDCEPARKVECKCCPGGYHLEADK